MCAHTSVPRVINCASVGSSDSRQTRSFGTESSSLQLCPSRDSSAPVARFGTRGCLGAPPRVLTPHQAVLRRSRHRNELPPLGSAFPLRQQPLPLCRKPSRTQISACTSCINVRSALGTAPFVILWSQDERRAPGAGSRPAPRQPGAAGLSAPAPAVTEQQTSEAGVAAQTHPTLFRQKQNL